MKATIRTIAKEVGVSPATVSRVFSGSARVSPQLRVKILNVAARAGYENGRGRNVALLFPPRVNLTGYGEMILDALFAELEKKGFRAMMFCSLELLDESVLSGAISIHYHSGLEKVWNRRRGIPLVCINNYGYPIDGVYEVSSDDIQGIGIAMEHLYEKGHRKIGMMTYYFDPSHSRNYSIRTETFHSFLKFHPDCSGLQVNCMLNDRILETTLELVRAGMTAILATGEGLGVQVNHILNACGIRVPEEISLIGYETKLCSKYLQPPQTCLEQRMGELAESAVELLEKQLRGERDLENRLIPYNLFLRDSVAPPHC